MNFNKLGLLVLSTGAIFMATSCNKSNPKIDSEEEFINAISFKDVDYLQIKQDTVMKMESPILENEEIEVKASSNGKMSPGVFYTISTGTQGEVSMYNESYATKKDEQTVTYIYRNRKESEFSQPAEMSMQEAKQRQLYTTPQDSSYLGMIQTFGIKFEDFTYKNNVYTLSDSTEAGEFDFTLSFANKKLIKAKYFIDAPQFMNVSGTDVLTYKKITPADPSKK